MDIKRIQSKYLDLIEDRLPADESRELYKLIAEDSELSKDFNRYKQLISLEKTMKNQKFELNENFTVKVMEQIDSQSAHGFIKRIIMNFQIPKRMLISGAATLAVCLIVGKIALEQKSESILMAPTIRVNEVSSDTFSKTKSATNTPSEDFKVTTDSLISKDKIAPAKKERSEVQNITNPSALYEIARQQTEPGILTGVAAPSSAYIGIAPDYIPPNYQAANTERYGDWTENPLISVNTEATSTFSIDVDTGSYTNMRRFIRLGQLPPADSVRIEEYINYFKYNYPAQYEKPFSVNYEIAPSPLESEKYLLKLGVKAKDVRTSEKAWNLVFLVDVSGSMQGADRLDLVKKSLQVLLNNMRAEDKVSLVTYAGNAGTLLEGASIKDKEKISSQIEALGAGGSTNGAGGIMEAYRIAQKEFIKDGVNRVILATDGDFNVGITNHDDLIKLVEEKRKSGVTLTTLGFGSENYNEAMMEQIANKGNGNYFYIDTFKEARKVFETDLFGTIEVVAKDVKLQIEFNPEHVSHYRLIGYENRKLNNQDFNNDAIDAGEIGSGHTVTALYEIVLSGSEYAKNLQSDSRYQKGSEKKPELNPAHAAELAFLKIRYKEPSAEKSVLTEFPIAKANIGDARANTQDFRFAAAVSYFAHLLRNSQYAGKYTYSDIVKLAESGMDEDKDGYRHEFIDLVKSAAALQKK